MAKSIGNDASIGGIFLKVVIFGGTGLVGKALVDQLLELGHSVIILTRKTPASVTNGVRYVEWLYSGAFPEKELEAQDVFINLAGASIGNGRWTNERKAQIVNSRKRATSEILRIISSLKDKPRVLINASAIGFYGTSETSLFTEDDSEPGDDFLARTVVEWEKTAVEAEKMGVRTVFCRFGVILAKEGGAFPRMVAPYKAFVGGTIGTGRQWVSWIHIADVVKGILFAISCPELHGPINFTAPKPVKMKDFGNTLAGVLRRPHWLPVPRFALQLLLGEMSTLVVDGQRVIPKTLLEHGFEFDFPDLQGALKNICARKY